MNKLKLILIFATLGLVSCVTLNKHDTHTPFSERRKNMIHIDKITIAVENIKQTTDFYSKTFDLELNEIDCGDFKMYIGKIDNIRLLFCPKNIAGITATENTIQLRFVVKDIKSTLEKGIKSGGFKLNDIREENGVITSALRDPDGNSIEIVQKQEN